MTQAAAPRKAGLERERREGSREISTVRGEKRKV